MGRGFVLSVTSSVCFIRLVSPTFAEDSICGAAPSLPTTTSSTESVKGQLQGQADILSKFVGKSELAGQIEAARESIYQSSDSFFAAQKDAYLAYLFCSIIMKDNSLNTSDKLRALEQFRKPPETPSIPVRPSEPISPRLVDRRGELKPGISTLNDAIKIFGEPSSESDMGEGETFVQWYWNNADSIAISFDRKKRLIKIDSYFKSK